MRKVTSIIFDLDGTLIDSKKDIVNSVNFTLSKLRLKNKSPAIISSYIGLGRDYLLRWALGRVNLDKLDKALKIFNKYYSLHLLDNTVLYSGVKYILEYFKDKRKIVISNRNTASANKTLKKLGIYHFIDYVLGGDDLECMKPSACPVLKVISMFKLRKKNTIMVGDMAVDIMSGKEAGILTCGVTYGIGRRKDIIKAKPDYIIDNIEDLKKIVEYAEH